LSIINRSSALPKGLGVIVGILDLIARSERDRIISAPILANGSEITRDQALSLCDSPEKFQNMVFAPKSRGKERPQKGFSNGRIEIIRLCEPFQGQPPESAEMRKSLT